LIWTKFAGLTKLDGPATKAAKMAQKVENEFQWKEEYMVYGSDSFVKDAHTFASLVFVSFFFVVFLWLAVFWIALWMGPCTAQMVWAFFWWSV
jgi:hypothetical protein